MHSHVGDGGVVGIPAIRRSSLLLWRGFGAALSLDNGVSALHSTPTRMTTHASASNSASPPLALFSLRTMRECGERAEEGGRSGDA